MDEQHLLGEGYESLIGPIEKCSSLFYEKVLKPGVPTSEHRYRNALFYLLCSQTSCYRYWGQGIWTDYGAVWPAARSTSWTYDS